MKLNKDNLDIGSLSHNEVFWAQKSSFLDDFWGQKSSHIEDFWAQNVCRVIMTISGARNHHYVISHREMTQMPQLPCMLELTGVITWLSWELQQKKVSTWGAHPNAVDSRGTQQHRVAQRPCVRADRRLPLVRYGHPPILINCLSPSQQTNKCISLLSEIPEMEALRFDRNTPGH